MRYRCEILNHGIHGYEVWLHWRNQGRSGVKTVLNCNTFFKNKLKSIKEKSLKMHLFSSELVFHIHDWLIISLKDFCIVIRKWPTFLLSTQVARLAPMSKQSCTLLFGSCHGIAGFLMDELQI